MNARILIVDDDEGMAELVENALRGEGYECEIRSSAEGAVAAFDERSADLIVTDIKMPGMSGTELFGELRKRYPALPFIFLTSYGTVRAAVDAMRNGAYSYLTKPFETNELRAQVERALQMTRLERENRFLRQEVASRYSPEAFVAESAHSQELLDLIRRVAPSRATILLQGESVTGKEMVARLIHFWSHRVGHPFVAINCKAFAESLLASELFGHEKGAFTGAITARTGCFERASGGTLLLDEIGSIGPDFQGKLLRVLQEGEVLRVGGAQARKVDARVVAATNCTLRDEVAAGRFREDLFFRLNVIPIFLTPLRARREDILPLAHYFLAQHGEGTRRARGFNTAAEKALLDHPWPGNVRELENAIERAVVMARGELISPEDLLLDSSVGSTSPAEAEGTLQECLDRAAAVRLAAALEQARGNRAAAARNLGIDRTSFYRLMKRLRLVDGRYEYN